MGVIQKKARNKKKENKISVNSFTETEMLETVDRNNGAGFTLVQKFVSIVRF